MPTGSILGRAVRRSEDARFLTGAARYVEDLPAEGARWAAFVRSPVAHGRLGAVETGEARGMPGVAGVWTAADLDGLGPLPAAERIDPRFVRPLLATDVVRYVGEPVAVVLAETRAQAADAAETVSVDVDPLPPLGDPSAALAAGAPVLFPDVGTNVARERTWRSKGKDPLADAEVVVRARFVNQRLAPLPMEPNAILAVPDPETEGLRVWVAHQAPHWFRDDLVKHLGLTEDQVHVIAPAVGGGFGAKAGTYPEQLVCAWLALRTGRGVRFVEARSENLVAMTHGRAQVQEVELAATREGVLTGLRLDVVADMGAYPIGTYLPALTRLMASGVYAIPRIEVRARSVLTTTTPVDAYRGAGRPEAAAMIERAMDLLARELEVDPATLRRRNFIAPDAFPYTTASEATYDVGDYAATLDEALRSSGYEELRREQAARRVRAERWQLGIGLATYVEITAWGSEFGSVEVRPDGSAVVRTGTSPHGQGHETAFAQLVTGTLGIPFERVRVIHSDTRQVPRGEGTMGSRSLQLGGSALHGAATEVLAKARLVASHLLEVAPEDLVPSEEAGGLALAGVPDRAVTWEEIAATAHDPERLPEGLQPGLAAQSDFEYGEDRNTFPFGAHVAVVEVDVETGRVRPLRHVAVDDCGTILNPLLVDGQVHGGVGQGVAQALYEEVLFDEDANPLTGSLMAYAMPSMADLPDIEALHTQTPTPLNPLGAKGIGEAGSIGSTPAVQNAVIDAVAHLGVRHIDLPLTPERVWRAMREAAGDPPVAAHSD